MRTRKIDSYYLKLGHTKSSSIEELLEKPLGVGINSLKVNNRWFDFVIEDRNADVTLISFSAALSQKIDTYPIFSARRLAEQLGVNYLGFADPAQGSVEALDTFWHLGTKRVNSSQFIPAIIEKACGSRKKLIFGSSAGGFAALRYAAEFPDSKVLVVNPRINLLHEPKRIPRFAPVAFPGADPTKLVRQLGYNMAELYKEPRNLQVTYLQNQQDNTYRRHHYAHFAKAVAGRDEVRFVFGEWGEGHVVAPNELIQEELQRLIDEPWTEEKGHNQ